MTARQIAETAIRDHKANQRVSELEQLVEIVKRLKPSRVLEIGSQDGGTLWAWSQVAADDAVLVSVDLPDPSYQHTPMRRHKRGDQVLAVIQADSTDPATAYLAESALGNEPVDFLFIDADHSYEAVSRDWANYSPLVRPGGVVALHDTACCTGVTQLWDEVKTDGYLEFVAAEDGFGACGIGVVFV